MLASIFGVSNLSVRSLKKGGLASFDLSLLVLDNMVVIEGFYSSTVSVAVSSCSITSVSFVPLSLSPIGL